MNNDYRVVVYTNPDPLLVMVFSFISIVIIILNIIIIIVGTNKIYRTGNPGWTLQSLGVISLLIFFSALFSSLWRLSHSFHFIATEPGGAAQEAAHRAAIGHNLKTIAVVIPAVALGLIGAWILGTMKRSKQAETKENLN